MAVNTRAFFLRHSAGENGVGTNKRASGLHPEQAPDIIWGQGTPDGDRAPFNALNKGSIYMEVNATDDDSHLWVKVDEAGADTDWIPFGAPSYAVSEEYNVDNGGGTTEDDIILVPDRAILIVQANLIFTEALGSGNAEGALFRMGTAVAGQEIVASVSLGNSQAVGSAKSLTIVSGVVAAGGMVAARHTGVATTVAGKYKAQIAYV